MARKSFAKRLRNFFMGVALVVVVLVVIAQFFLGSIIKGVAENAGPMLLGAPVKIETANVRLFSGNVRFGGVVVGPPEGYNENVFELSDFVVRLDVGSLFTDTIVIKEVSIDGPKVVYEFKVPFADSNIDAITSRLAKGGQDEKSKAGEKEKTAGKKIVVEEFAFRGGNVKIASATLGGAGVPIPLPNIELTDVGKQNGGVTAIELTGQIFASIGGGVINVAKDALVGIGGLAVDGAKIVGSAAAAVGGVAADSAKAVGSAAVDGMKAVGGALIGLFGGGRSTETNALGSAEK